MPFRGDISMTYLHKKYVWELGSVGDTYFYKNFYETHSISSIQFCILTGNEKREFKSDIPDTRTDCTHLIIISISVVF